MQTIAVKADQHVLVWPQRPANALHEHRAVFHIMGKAPRRAAGVVTDHTAGFYPKFESSRTQGKAQVNVFKTVAVGLMKSPAGFKIDFAQHDGRAGNGLQRMVIARRSKCTGQVLVEMPHGVERRHIDAAVLHRAVGVQQQRAHGPQPGIGHGLAQRGQPVWRERCVVVQKEQQVSVCRLRPGVAAPGETHIFRHANGLERSPKKRLAQGRKFGGRGIGRMVVHNHNLHVFASRMLGQRTQAGLCHFPEIPDRNDNRNAAFIVHC